MNEAEFANFQRPFVRMTMHVADGAVIAAVMDWRHLFELQTAARRVGLSMLNLCVGNKTNGGMGPFVCLPFNAA